MVETNGAVGERHARDYAMHLHSTRGEMSKFAANLEASRVYIAEVESQYKHHVEHNFSVVEAECLALRQAYTAIGVNMSAQAAGTGDGHGGSVGRSVSALEFNLSKGRTDNHERLINEIAARVKAIEEQCHCNRCPKRSRGRPCLRRRR